MNLYLSLFIRSLLVKMRLLLKSMTKRDVGLNRLTSSVSVD